jgi:hypothetical protein
MSCLSWLCKGSPFAGCISRSRTDDRFNPNAFRNINIGTPDIPGGLAGIKQRMTSLGHFMNDHVVVPENQEKLHSGLNPGMIPGERSSENPSRSLSSPTASHPDNLDHLSAPLLNDDGKPTSPPPQPPQNKKNRALPQGQMPFVFSSHSRTYHALPSSPSACRQAPQQAPAAIRTRAPGPDRLRRAKPGAHSQARRRQRTRGPQQRRAARRVPPRRRRRHGAARVRSLGPEPRSAAGGSRSRGRRGRDQTPGPGSGRWRAGSSERAGRRRRRSCRRFPCGGGAGAEPGRAGGGRGWRRGRLAAAGGGRVAVRSAVVGLGDGAPARALARDVSSGGAGGDPPAAPAAATSAAGAEQDCRSKAAAAAAAAGWQG